MTIKKIKREGNVTIIGDSDILGIFSGMDFDPDTSQLEFQVGTKVECINRPESWAANSYFGMQLGAVYTITWVFPEPYTIEVKELEGMSLPAYCFRKI